MHYMLLDVPIELETERLLLRPYIPGDGQWLHAIFRENKVHLSDSLEGIKAGFSLDLTDSADAEIFVRQLAADWVARRRFIFGIWEKDPHRYVGELWIESQDWDVPLHEIGYFVVEEHLRKGFATEAAKAAIGFVFEHLKSNKASVTCDEDNVPSYRVAERCGFLREGRLRAQVKRRDGAPVGKLYYGMLRAEFEALDW